VWSSQREDALVDEWQRDDATLIIEMLARIDAHVLELGEHATRIRSLLKD
jgi:hypothetical protein